MKYYNSLAFIVDLFVVFYSSASQASNTAPSISGDHGGDRSSSTPKKHSNPHWSYSGSLTTPYL